jgi:xanthine dehydrogenase YagS FAD-binding subunit
MLRTFAYVRPGSVSEALKQLEERGSRVHAGGTDLLGCLRDGVFAASRSRRTASCASARSPRSRSSRRIP